MHFQNAIPRLANRKPVERDYTAWLGFRSLSEAAMKSGKVKPKDVKDYLLSEDFKLEAFKGQALSFRTPGITKCGSRSFWVAAPYADLHLAAGRVPASDLTDTLGFDEPGPSASSRSDLRRRRCRYRRWRSTAACATAADPADSAALHRVRTYLERAPRPALGIAVLSHTAAIGNKDC